MSTAPTNQLLLTPVAGSVRPRFFVPVVRPVTDIGHSRSLPAEPDGTYRSGFVKPATPIEKPTEVSSTASPMEPARTPVPGASKD